VELDGDALRIEGEGSRELVVPGRFSNFSAFAHRVVVLASASAAYPCTSTVGPGKRSMCIAPFRLWPKIRPPTLPCDARCTRVCRAYPKAFVFERFAVPERT
jgi:hypothetical protein